MDATKQAELTERARQAGQLIAERGVPVTKLEALAEKLKDPKFRSSVQFQLVLNSL